MATKKEEKAKAKAAANRKAAAETREQKKREKKLAAEAAERAEAMKTERERWLDLLGQKEEWLDLTTEKIMLADFLATPQTKRKTNLKGFADLLGVSQNTITAWQMDDSVNSLRRAMIKAFFTDYTPEVVLTLAQAATTPDEHGRIQVPASKLFLEYVEGFNSDGDEVTQPNIIINIGDNSIGPSAFVNADQPGMREHIEKNKVPDTQRAK